MYYLPAGTAQPLVVDSAVVKPNGIVGTPDGRNLYVADIGAGKTYRYAIGQDGKPGERQLFVPQGSDAPLKRGDVYLTGDGVTVYDPAGNRIAHIRVPEEWTANLCFGGTDKKTLFITASKGLYRIRMLVRGVE